MMRSLLFVIFIALLVFSPIAHGVELPLGGRTPENDPQIGRNTPVGMVNDFYILALAVSGILAFGAIVLGAVKYAASVGNSTLQGDAKDQIKQALLGLLLLLGAVIILNTINPDLTTLSIDVPRIP